jgi:hypothetical protein
MVQNTAPSGHVTVPPGRRIARSDLIVVRDDDARPARSRPPAKRFGGRSRAGPITHDHVDGNAPAIDAQTCSLMLEGIVSSGSTRRTGQAR